MVSISQQETFNDGNKNILFDHDLNPRLLLFLENENHKTWTLKFHMFASCEPYHGSATQNFSRKNIIMIDILRQLYHYFLVIKRLPPLQ